MEVYKEVWRDIPEYEGLYKISSMGRVKRMGRITTVKTWQRVEKEMFLKTRIGGSGFLIVELSKNGKTRIVKVTDLIVKTFIGEKHNHKAVYKNRDIEDSRLENIDYIKIVKPEKIKPQPKKTIGIFYNEKSQKWYPVIRENNKLKNLGLFNTIREALESYESNTK